MGRERVKLQDDADDMYSKRLTMKRTTPAVRKEQPVVDGERSAAQLLKSDTNIWDELRNVEGPEKGAEFTEQGNKVAQFSVN